ncbi:MAG TPA: SMP-30/gluconolactonase/LRE family protein [Usitatibacter sp.]|nr:SMP-30/gluconolactonase/LRE family protein [Usitatibacter sp.]
MRALALLAFLTVVSLAVPAQDDAGAAIRARKAAVEKLLRERPRDATLWFHLARLDAQAGDARDCAAALEKVAELGDGFLPARELGFEKVWNDPAFEAARAKLESRLPRLDYAPIAFELDDTALVPEGIAYDAPSKSFFVGGVAGHRIVRIDENREESEFAGPAAGLDAVLGLAVDAPRRRLYAVTTSALSEPNVKPARNAVVAFDLVTRQVVKRFDVRAAAQLNDVAVAAGGRVYATDSGAGAVYEIPAQGDPRALVPPGALPGANGIAASPDGRRLYVAHSTGIAWVDVASGAVKRMAVASRENVAAIDGLYQWQGMLIGVQNVTNPGRVIAITLARDGESIAGVRTLLSHHQRGLDEPTTGAVGPDGFYLLGATGVGHVGADGRIERPESVPHPTVLRVLLPR